MAIGLVGRKCGMTRIFTEAGVSVPVTVIEVDPNRITQIKTLETDGYQAIQVTTGERRESRVTNGQKVTLRKQAWQLVVWLKSFVLLKQSLKVVKLVLLSVLICSQ